MDMDRDPFYWERAYPAFFRHGSVRYGSGKAVYQGGRGLDKFSSAINISTEYKHEGNIDFAGYCFPQL